MDFFPTEQVEEGKEEHLHRPFQACPSCHLAAIVNTFEESCAAVAAAAATFLLTVAWHHVDSFVKVDAKAEKNHYFLQMVDR